MRPIWTHVHAVIALVAVVGQFTGDGLIVPVSAAVTITALTIHAYMLRADIRDGVAWDRPYSTP